jgi:hypothetical protein
VSAQALAALESANRIRRERAEWARENFALNPTQSKARAAEALRDLSEATGTYKLREFLKFAVRRCGPATITLILQRAKIDPARLDWRVSDIPPWEREQIARALTGEPTQRRNFEAVGL